MAWIKNVIVDIIVTLVIAVAFWLHKPWMWWVIAVYTLLLLAAKGVALKSDGFMRKGKKFEEAPEWFLHLLYALNVLFLALASWWYLFAGWALIWLFSFLSQRNLASA